MVITLLGSILNIKLSTYFIHIHSNYNLCFHCCVPVYGVGWLCLSPCSYRLNNALRYPQNQISDILCLKCLYFHSNKQKMLLTTCSQFIINASEFLAQFCTAWYDCFSIWVGLTCNNRFSIRTDTVLKGRQIMPEERKKTHLLSDSDSLSNSQNSTAHSILTWAKHQQTIRHKHRFTLHSIRVSCAVSRSHYFIQTKR